MAALNAGRNEKLATQLASRDAIAPELMHKTSLEKRGRRECRAHDAPAASRAK